MINTDILRYKPIASDTNLSYPIQTELYLIQTNFLKRREGGPKGRPSKASLNFFWECWLIMVNVWSDQIVKIRKIIVWSHATYGRKCEAKEASDGRKNNAGAELSGR